MGEVVVARGEVWWGETQDQKGRPFLVVRRDAANAVMRRVLVEPVTTRIRRIPSEVDLGSSEGLPRESVASFDNVRPFPKALLVRRLGSLSAARLSEICRAAAATFDC
jgi:mRNA-degrading endonuclease toxin of MazEF toxin-antitoxin module